MTASRALRNSLRAEVALLAVLTLSGLWLSWYYRPTVVRAYVFSAHGAPAAELWAARARALHRLAGTLFVWNALLTLGLCIARAVKDTAVPRSRVWILGLAFALAAWATGFTGFLLPWDQLALRAITIGSNVRGLWSAAYSHNVRYVLIGNSEVSRSTLRNWFLTHAFVLPPWLLAGLVLLLRRTTKD